MRHLTITTFGCFIGLESKRLVVKEKDKVIGEYPIARLKTVQVAASGVSFSSNLLYELSLRGISFFVLDFKSIPVLVLSGTQQHAVVELRKHQFQFSESNKVPELCQKIILGKLKNQRSVLLYFSKSQNINLKNSESIQKGVLSLENTIQELKSADWLANSNWRERLLGTEGGGAHIYWNTLRESDLFPDSFEARKGRGASDIVNQALNLGYSILMSYIWNAVIKSGLEPYLGFFHVVRPGKPSLILDIMEEYRAWVVDRSVIKLRHLLEKEKTLTPEIKKRVIEEIHETFSKTYPFYGKKLKLETMLQRQVYRLCGFIYGKKKYKAISFKW
ncbi:MAG TPA: CRISPR-associated endonuclease Cas1 [Leptospiraceae bacterium]|nr:CRISPR-associated endonuclease Cas1 [Leptospiraceae bacterium]HMW08617.1 CRISPR-associated endonuclease Cas1 [Leptospiraceae bacterium]HMX34573.1 CRISPR-associated endonuclease Cas1 [Leptospiraceae bacterium]HMY34363.1 CRISPR-associated endonuclease Cas1 [Leptospiraceae bacterium]HMZ66673.1 CRISPR-associated endonuclease Cas1 [Leptospiraceae bacterium]